MCLQDVFPCLWLLGEFVAQTCQHCSAHTEGSRMFSCQGGGRSQKWINLVTLFCFLSLFSSFWWKTSWHHFGEWFKIELILTISWINCMSWGWKKEKGKEERQEPCEGGREERRVCYYWNASRDLIADRCRDREPGCDPQPLCEIDAETVITQQHFKALT